MAAAICDTAEKGEERLQQEMNAQERREERHVSVLVYQKSFTLYLRCSLPPYLTRSSNVCSANDPLLQHKLSIIFGERMEGREERNMSWVTTVDIWDISMVNNYDFISGSAQHDHL